VEDEEIDGAPEVLTSKKSSVEDPLQENEANLVEWVSGLSYDAERAKEEACDPDAWPDTADVYWGDVWPDGMPSYKPRITVNEIKSLVLQELSDLTDSRMLIYVKKTMESTDRDKVAEDSIHSLWQNRFFDMAFFEATLDSMIYPLGFLQGGWDPYLEQGQGNVLLKARDPRTVFPDPDAENDEDRKYWITKDVMDLVTIRRMWPETGPRVQPEANWSEKYNKKQSDKSGPGGSAGYVGPLYTKTGGAGAPGWRKARAEVLTCVVEDDDTMEELHRIGDRLSFRTVYRYPHKRCLIVANKRVLYDGDMPYHHGPNLIRVATQPTVHSYWPKVSTVWEYGEIQNTANKLDSLVAENALRLNRGEVFADADSGINPKTYGNIPGGVYLIKPGSKVQKSYPGAMPADMVQGGERMRGFIRQNMGYPLSRQGAGTHGNIAAELAETEISQSMGLTRLRGRLLHHAAVQTVRMVFGLMAQFYTFPRHLPYNEHGEWKKVQWEPIASPDQYAVHVDSSTFAVKSKTMVQRMALTLAKMQKLPTEELLKALEYPNAEEVARKMQAELMLMAAAKMNQRGGKGAKRG
jgi:hypothetical protein